MRAHSRQCTSAFVSSVGAVPDGGAATGIVERETPSRGSGTDFLGDATGQAKPEAEGESAARLVVLTSLIRRDQALFGRDRGLEVQ
jgi:hypothetical protein